MRIALSAQAQASRETSAIINTCEIILLSLQSRLACFMDFKLALEDVIDSSYITSSSSERVMLSPACYGFQTPDKFLIPPPKV
jgi:hypothetical protein